ncbi:dihydrodipicolinate synthase family protein [Bacillus tuaregi]|uniref:dihydrodipicolinate synthase family protein n=1 Tax=Bacillus tuaregi TaxID=1816695 RepID=UPI0008F8E80E|nr:dihydrodipicolinate synthase family protein [Bacillus tuaregi]
MRETVQDVKGIYAIIPTPALPFADQITTEDTVDYEETVRAVNQMIEDGVDAIMTTGTFGEAATLTWDEHLKFVATVVEAAKGRVPIYAGATTLNTRDTIARARAFQEKGVSGLLLGRPMWCECDDDSIVSYYRGVAEAVPDLGIIVYDNPVAFKGKISSAVYAKLAEIPSIIAAKCTSLNTAFWEDVEAVKGKIRMLPMERNWYEGWRAKPDEVLACWSGAASCGPQPAVALKRSIFNGDEQKAQEITEGMQHASSTFFPNGDFKLFAKYNIQLEKIRINEAGYINAGPSRPPYTKVPEEYAEGARVAGRRLAQLRRKYDGSKAR